MQALLTADRRGRAPVRGVLRTTRSHRITRTITTIGITRTLRGMLLLTMDPTTYPDMALKIAITVGMVRHSGLGPEAYL